MIILYHIIHRNFHQEKILPTSPSTLIGKYFCLLSCVKDCIEDMATFTALVNTNFFCNTKVAGLGEIFIQRNVYVYSMFLEIKEKDCLAHLYIIGM